MKKKSKFLTFLLSFIPGLGHMYLGLMQRGLVFFLATGFVFLAGMFFSMMGIFYDPIPFVALPFIWLAAVVDSLIFAGRINRSISESEATGISLSDTWKNLENELKNQNHKILALTFSMVPGAGHMYLGQMEKGIQLMVALFLTLYLSDFLHISLLLMFAPILWFYSIFDIFHRISNPNENQGEAIFGEFFKKNQLSGKVGKILGVGLIVVGFIMIFDKIVMPQIAIMLGDQIREYLRTGILALLFIGGGVKLMIGSKEKTVVSQITPTESSSTAESNRE
ncbi:MAG: hypothetical protein APF84_01025 [Gracilibacter sp. BRH_c7a]|nr:MAG: hypothetical protein APF84_01025 [Gracilibacter sp. BRH_c7a]